MSSPEIGWNALIKPLAFLLCTAALGPSFVDARIPRERSAQEARERPPDAAIVALRTGRYEEAISSLRLRLRADGSTAQDHRALVRALNTVGRYEEAEGVARSFIAARPESPDLWNALGETLYLVGDIEAAADAFRAAVEGRASDRLTAELNLAVHLFRGGDLDAAMLRFDTFIDAYNSGLARSSEDLTAVGIACSYLGRNNPQLFHDAVTAFDKAIDADPSNLEPRVRLAELLVAKYNSTEAGEILRGVLEINPDHPAALLAMARVLDFDGEPGSRVLLDHVLEINPDSVTARVRLAEMHLERESWDEAQREVERALDINPSSLEALTVLAATHFLRGDRPEFEAARDRALRIGPRNAELYNTLAELCVRNRLYEQAVQFAEHATELDDASWRAYGILGLNQLRTGAIEEGRANLEISFDGDPFNVWNKNTLDLLDTFPDYEVTSSRRFEMMIEGPESDLISLYLGELADEAYERLAEHYQFEPATPIRLEVYPSHADFSVRTIGLAGLGALGVSFGPVIAIDSPSARPVGEFNWGSTVWHEIGHTFTLGLTDHRIPRWLSEGLSVYEEHRSRPGWGSDISAGFLLAFLTDQLHPVSRLTDGFVRPSYPQQIAYSYYQAALVCHLIERDWGFAAILGILAGYRSGDSTEEIFRAELGIEMDELDDRFAAYVEERFAGPLAALRPAARHLEDAGRRGVGHAPPLEELEVRVADSPDDFTAHLALGMKMLEVGRLDEAEEHLSRAQEMFPEYAGNDSPYLYLAHIAKQRGDALGAEKQLARFTAINENNYDAHVELADLRENLGDPEGAAEALERALYIYPLDMSVHLRLAELFTSTGQHEKVVRERRAVLALDPADRAEALYQLALALYRSGDPAAARRQVLGALEIAPSYDAAQELLLEILGRKDTEVAR
jgi:tetratricopeptide (TPR) repeat protein